MSKAYICARCTRGFTVILGGSQFVYCDPCLQEYAQEGNRAKVERAAKEIQDRNKKTGGPTKAYTCCTCKGEFAYQAHSPEPLQCMDCITKTVEQQARWARQSVQNELDEARLNARFPKFSERTLLDEIALEVMKKLTTWEGVHEPERFAKQCYSLALAMMAERKKRMEL